MANTNKITERASEFAGTAAQAAGPAIDRAKELATDLVERAAPLVEKAAPFVEKAAHATAQGVATAGTQLDRATKGKYSEQISSVTSKIGARLDPKP